MYDVYNATIGKLCASGLVGRALDFDARGHRFDAQLQLRLRAICKVWYFGALCIVKRGLLLAGAYSVKILGTGTSSERERVLQKILWGLRGMSSR